MNDCCIYILCGIYIYTQYNLKLKNLRNKENIKTLQIISVIGNYQNKNASFTKYNIAHYEELREKLIQKNRANIV